MSSKISTRVSRNRPNSPVHLFVDKDTPVHVYMDKGDNDQLNTDYNSMKSSTVKCNKIKRPRKPGYNVPTSKLIRSPTQRVRSMSPPWVPPPGKTTKTPKSTLGPFWNNEEAEISQQERYEQQINDLLNEVGDLQDQVNAAKDRDKLRDNQNTILSQEEQIEELKQEMDHMEKENNLLRDSLDKSRSNLNLSPEYEKMIQVLIETELAGERCAHQMQHVFDYLKTTLQEGYRITSRDMDRINTLFHDTESRLFEFKSISSQMREMLKELQHTELNAQSLLEKETGYFLKKQKQFEDDISNFELELGDKDKVINDLRRQLAIKNEESINYASTHESLENVKGHLQQQLKQKSGDCNRMAVQIRTLENELARERIDKEQLIERLKNPKDRGLEDRDTLKKAARAQKQRALKAEETIQELTSLLAEKEKQLEELMPLTTGNKNHMTNPSSHCDHCPENENHSFHDLPQKSYWPSSAQSNNVINNDTDLLDKECVHQTVQCQMNSREDQDNLRNIEDENDLLHRRIINNDEAGIINALKTENENLRLIADQCQCRLRDVEREMKTLRQTISEENDDQNEDQISKLSRLCEKLETSERMNQNSQMRIEDLERKIKSLENQNFEMKNTVQVKENCAVDNRCKVEELIRENASLMRQLEAALTDSRRNADNAREKMVGKDRQLQSRVHEIESQLAQQRAEANKWRQNCEETERKLQSKIQDMKLQLEQTEITNRSMQTYVQFLKKSYANVFGDMPLSNGYNGINAPYMGQSLSFGGF